MGVQENKRRYREKNRETLRAKGRAYQAAKRRAAGMPALGTPESTENRRHARKLTGPEHPNWKGDAASYSALHHWIKLHGTRTGICSECGATPDPPERHRKVGTEWANVSGEYHRDVDDYVELCCGCHRRRDRRVD